MKLPGKNTGGMLQGIGMRTDVSAMTPKAQANKVNIDSWD